MFSYYTTEVFLTIVCIFSLTMFILYVLGIVDFEAKIEKKPRWKTEAKVGEYLKLIFPDHTFTKIRPVWLKNPRTGKNLELDFYCKELNLAVEVNGIQHSEYNPFFHKNDPIRFIKQQQRDGFKVNKCKELGIKLLSVPHTVEKDELYNYISTKCIELGKL